MSGESSNVKLNSCLVMPDASSRRSPTLAHKRRAPVIVDADVIYKLLVFFRDVIGQLNRFAADGHRGGALTLPAHAAHAIHATRKSAVSVSVESRCTQRLLMTQYWAERYSSS